MLIRCAGMGAKISISVTMKGAQKNLKVCWGFRTTYFIMKKIKKSGSVTYINKNSLLSHNCQGINPHIQIGNHLNVQARHPKFKEGFKSQQALDRHMDVHKGKLLKCDIQGCTKSFSMCNYLRAHKNTVHGEPYECKHILDGCKFKCKSHKTLLDHHKLFCPFNLDRSDVN